MESPETIYRSEDGRVEIYRRPDGTYGVKTQTRENSLGEVQATIGYLTREELDHLVVHLLIESMSNAFYFDTTSEPEITA